MVEKIENVASGQKPAVAVEQADVGEKKSKMWLWIVIAVAIIVVAGLVVWLV